MLQYILNGGGGNIGHVLIIESNEGSHSIIDEIIETLKKHPDGGVNPNVLCYYNHNIC